MRAGLHAGKEIRLSDHERLLYASRIADKVRPGSGGCLEWTGALQTDVHTQRPKIYVDGRAISAHRVALACVNGSLAGGVCVLHSCDNPMCVNPAHLREGTPADNMRDMAERRRCYHGGGGKRKVSEAMLAWMLIAHNKGASTNELVRRTGLSKPTVRKWLRRLSASHG
jgi:hypothetical protein